MRTFPRDAVMGFLRPARGITPDTSRDTDLAAGPAQGIVVQLQSTPWLPEALTEILRGSWGGKGTNLPGHSPRAAATSCKPSGSSVLLPFSCQDCPGSTAGEGGRRKPPRGLLLNATAVARGRWTSRCAPAPRAGGAVPAEPCPAPGTTTKPLQGASPAATTRPGSGPRAGAGGRSGPPGPLPRCRRESRPHRRGPGGSRAGP